MELKFLAETYAQIKVFLCWTYDALDLDLVVKKFISFLIHLCVEMNLFSFAW